MASATTWRPHEANFRNHWLLTNGQVIVEPELEISGSGRRVRVSGLQKTSTPSGQRSDLLWQTVRADARAVGAKPWISLGVDSPDADPFELASKLIGGSPLARRRPTPMQLVDGEDNEYLIWEFRHADFPVVAQLVVSFGIKREWSRSAAKYEPVRAVDAFLRYPRTFVGDTEHLSARDATRPAGRLGRGDSLWEQGISGRHSDDREIDQWLSGYQAGQIARPDWVSQVPTGEKSFSTQREAGTYLATLVRAIEDLDQIEIPDFRDMGDVSYLPLQRHSSNGAEVFLDELTTFLDAEPTVNKIRATWTELIELFARLGIVVGDVRDSEFHHLVMNEDRPLEVDVSAQRQDHAIRVNLTTGAIVVGCGTYSSDDSAAGAWEASLVRAKLTGQDDALLAYAKAHKATLASRRANDLMDAHAARLHDATA